MARALDDEVDLALALALAPPVQPQRADRCGRGEVRAHRGLDEPPPSLGIGARLFERQTGGRGDQRVVVDLQLRAARPAPRSVARVLVQPRHHPGRIEQIEVVGQRDGVAGVLQRAEHLRVRQHLPRVSASELEQPAQQRRLVHPGKQQHVARDRGLDQRVEQVARPAGRLVDEGRRARIPAVVDVALPGPAEGRMHLGEAPVPQVQHLEAAGEAVAETARDQQRRRPQQHDLQRPACTRILVPEALHVRRPVRDLLHLVDDQDRPFRTSRQRARRVPLRFQPDRRLQARSIRASPAARQADPLEHLLDERGLAHLPGAGDHLQEAARLLQPALERGGLGADEGGSRCRRIASFNE